MDFLTHFLLSKDFSLTMMRETDNKDGGEIACPGCGCWIEDDEQNCCDK